MPLQENMRRTIQFRETKAERKAERQKIGKLEDQRTSPGTSARYQRALDELCEFSKASQSDLLKRSDLGGILCAYNEKLWEDGETKLTGSYTMAAVQFFRPELKVNLARHGN